VSLLRITVWPCGAGDTEGTFTARRAAAEGGEETAPGLVHREPQDTLESHTGEPHWRALRQYRLQHRPSEAGWERMPKHTVCHSFSRHFVVV
jgi:hypothetical protein